MICCWVRLQWLRLVRWLTRRNGADNGSWTREQWVAMERLCGNLEDDQK